MLKSALITQFHGNIPKMQVWDGTPQPVLEPAPGSVTWLGSFLDAACEDVLGELGLVVILVCHRDDDLHGVLHTLPIGRHGVGEELGRAQGRGASAHCPPAHPLNP